MNLDEILALYDQEQRWEVEYPSVRREVTPEVVRHVALSAREQGFVIYSQLGDRSDIDAVIQAQITYFANLGQAFEWKVYTHDRPADLPERLAAHGFEVKKPEAIMVLDTAAAPAALLQPVRQDVRRITPKQLGDVILIQEQVWQSDFGGLAERLLHDLQTTPDQLSIYVAYEGGAPASTAWIYFHPDSQFAGLWGGSTLPAYRQRGLYTALLAARLQEARQQGVRFLTVDASPMSRPILEKHGFQLITTAYPCRWRPKQA